MLQILFVYVFEDSSLVKFLMATKGKRKVRFSKEQILQDYRICTSHIPSAVPICENDLTNPTPEKIQQIYLSILTGIQAESVESFKQSAFITQSFDHPEIMDDITFLIQFSRVMKRLMSAANVHDFGMMDLSFPDSKRTIRCLGSLFNLLRFQTNVFEGDETTTVIGEETDKLREQCGELQITNKGARRKLKELEKQRVEERELEQDLKQAILAQQQEAHALHMQHEAAINKYHTVSDAYTKAEQKQAGLEKELRHWTQRDDDLRMQIVSSPEKLMATLAQLESQVQESRVTNEETNALLIKWESIVSNAHTVPPVIEGLNEDLKILADKVTKKSEIEARLETIGEQIGRLQQVIREANAKHQNLTMHLKLIEGEAAHAQYEGQHKLPHLNHLDDLLSDVRQLQQAMEEKMKSDAELELEIMKIRAKVAEVRERYDEDCKRLEGASQRLSNALDSQMKQCADLIAGESDVKLVSVTGRNTTTEP